MSYVTQEEVRLILDGTTGDLPASGSSLSDEQINAEIERVESEIDTALRGIYTVPFDPVPVVIKYIARDMAIYYSDLTFRMSNGYAASLDPILLRYRAAKAILDNLSKGVYSLDAEGAVSGESLVINPFEGPLISSRHLFGPAIYG